MASPTVKKPELGNLWQGHVPCHIRLSRHHVPQSLVSAADGPWPPQEVSASLPAPSRHTFLDKSQRPTVFKQHGFPHPVRAPGPPASARGTSAGTPLPHALRGLVAVVPVQLRHAQHGFRQHGQEAQRLHKQSRVDGQVGDVACHTREGQDTLHIVCEAAPVPEVTGVEV